MRLPIITLLLLFAFALSAQTSTREFRASVYFASASAELDQEAKTLIADFTADLMGYADFSIRLEAFTDERGKEDYNETLARDRAARVKTFLEATGIATGQWTVSSHGERQARTNTTNDAERRTDRRVDLVATVTTWSDMVQVYAELRNDLPQEYTIDPAQQQTIVGKDGGRFLIEANSLVDADGNPVTGPVSIGLVEAYSLDNMLLAGLTTTSGDRTLETGGMFQLTATDEEGNPLSLAPGQSIASSIPTNDFNPEMQIFNGQHVEDSGELDWAVTPMRVTGSSAALMPLYDGPRLKRWEYDGREEFAAWKKNNPEPELVLRPVASNRKKPVAPDTSAIRWEPNLVDGLFASKAKRARMRQELVAKAWDRYEQQQKVYAKRVRISVENEAYNVEAKAAFPDQKKAWELAAEAEKERIAEKNSAKNAALRAEYEKRREAWFAKRKATLEASLSGDDLTGKGDDLNRYFFTINTLGWINCDVFYGEEDPIMVQAVLKQRGEGAKVILIPEGRRAMLPYNLTPSGIWVARGIPRNTGYRIIAYQISEGQLQFGEQEVVAASTEAEQLAFRPVSVPELQAILRDMAAAK